MTLGAGGGGGGAGGLVLEGAVGGTDSVTVGACVTNMVDESLP